LKISTTKKTEIDKMIVIDQRSGVRLTTPKKDLVPIVAKGRICKPKPAITAKIRALFSKR